jgi:hypothetical protein
LPSDDYLCVGIQDFFSNYNILNYDFHLDYNKEKSIYKITIIIN